jgi:hypothetical protein
MPVAKPCFALCIHKGAEDDVEIRKLYQILPATSNEAGFLRIIDEAGEDYLYPSENFVMIDVPQDAEAALLQAA